MSLHTKFIAGGSEKRLCCDGEALFRQRVLLMSALSPTDVKKLNDYAAKTPRGVGVSLEQQEEALKDLTQVNMGHQRHPGEE